jgi:hypothetical protein
VSTPSFPEPDGQWHPTQYPPAPDYPPAPEYPPAQQYPPAQAYPPGPVYPPASVYPPSYQQPPAPLARAERRPLGPDLRFGVATAAVIALLGLGLGALWSTVAPWVPAVRAADGAILAQPEQEQMIAGEGWYLIITVLAGVAVSVLAWVVLRRYRGVAVLAGVVVGSVAAGILAYWLGHHIGLSHARYLADHAPVGTAFSIPPNLRAQHIGLWHGWLPYAKGDVLAMAIASAVTYLLFAGFSSSPTLLPASGEDSTDEPVSPVNTGW